ncbi:MAG: hypothetical protein ABJA82_14125 [Myxococcales bacterium]
MTMDTVSFWRIVGVSVVGVLLGCNAGDEARPFGGESGRAADGGANSSLGGFTRGQSGNGGTGILSVATSDGGQGNATGGGGVGGTSFEDGTGGAVGLAGSGGNVGTGTGTGGVPATGGAGAAARTGGAPGSGGIQVGSGARTGAAGSGGKAASGGASASGGTPASGGATASGGSQGSGGAMSMGTGGAMAVSPECQKLMNDYDAKMKMAKECPKMDPMMPPPMDDPKLCQTAVPSKLTGCGSECMTYVDNPRALDDVRKKWMDMKCPSVACPNPVCSTPVSGSCTSAGSCVDNLR